jgi:lipopolysaccharide export system protein LptA
MKIIRLFIFCCLSLGYFPILAQQATPDSLSAKLVEVDHADVLSFVQLPDKSYLQVLSGAVELRQDSIFMYCDSATIRQGNYVVAKGNVIIQQGDSTSIFADSLIYDGEIGLAEFFGEVILTNGKQRLFTQKLTYDVGTKIATYLGGGTMVSDSLQLSSQRGYYYADSSMALFREDVVLIDTAFTLLSDSLQYFTSQSLARFFGPTSIRRDSTLIYCEAGEYQTDTQVGAFYTNAVVDRGAQLAEADTINFDGQQQRYLLIGNARFSDDVRKASADRISYDESTDVTILSGRANYTDDTQAITGDYIYYDATREIYKTRGRSLVSNPPQLLEADTIDFDETSGMGLASGSVIWRDTSAQLSITCARVDFQQRNDFIRATGGAKGRPLLTSQVEGDTLFLTADTLTAFRPDTTGLDSSRVLLAHYDVRLYKSNLQALADSLIYLSADSSFHFFYGPILWSDTTQFLADSITVALKNDAIDQIFLQNNGLIVNSPDEIYFNQIKGKNITAFFTEGDIRQMDVSGNAESLYYALDDQQAYIGLNQTVCSEMRLFFEEKTINRISFYTEPKGGFLPMNQVDHEAVKLRGFCWETEARPAGLGDLFGPRKVIQCPHAVQLLQRGAASSTKEQPVQN